MSNAAADALWPEPAEALDGYVLDEQVGFLLRRAHQRHAAVFQEGIGDPDLTPRQFAALVRLVEVGGATQNHLGRLAAMDTASIQGVVRRLTERGYVTRAADPLDRRSAVLAPTAAGIAAVRRAVPCARRITAAILDPLTAAERRVLLALLRKLG